MNKMKRKVAMGLFISSFFFRFGFCLILFVVGVALGSVNIWFLRFGVAALLFDLIVSVIDTIRCLAVTKNSSGNPAVDDLFAAMDDPDATEDDISDIVDRMAHRYRVDRPDNPFLPVAEQLKETLKEGMTVKEATEVFREVAESSEVSELYTDEEVFFIALVGRRHEDGKKYFVLNFNLGHGRDSMSVNMLFKHRLSDPDTHLTIYCDEGREAFYQEVYDHARFQKYEKEVPLFIDVVCGNNS